MISNEIKAIKEEYYSKWVSPRGMTLLDVGHDENSNGILFHCEFIDQLQRLNALEQSDLDFTFNVIYSLQRREKDGTILKGIFNRRPDADNDLEAHDNRVAIVRLSQVFKFAFGREMVETMLPMGMSHNNVEPKKALLKTTSQGGDTALYFLGIGWRPEILNCLWLCCGLLIAAFKGNPSVTLLSNVRRNVIAQTLKEWLDPTDLFFYILGPTVSLFDFFLKRRGGLREIQKSYFVSLHPICRLTEINLK